VTFAFDAGTVVLPGDVRVAARLEQGSNIPEDEQAIRIVVSQYLAARERGDEQAIGSLFTAEPISWSPPGSGGRGAATSFEDAREYAPRGRRTHDLD